MFWQSSAIRVTMTVMSMFVLASVVIVGAIYLQTSQIMARRDMSGVLAETRALSEMAAREGLQAMLAGMRRRKEVSNLALYGLADAQGRTVWLSGMTAWPAGLQVDNRSGSFEYIRPETPQPAQAAATEEGSTNDGAGLVRRLAIGATLRLPDGERLLVARDITEHRQLAHAIRNWFLIGIALLSSLAIAAGWTINRLLMQRLAGMTDTTSSIMAGDLTKRVPLSANDDEFDALAENLNAMLDRIETLMQGLREVSDNIAHDLKTPLNRLRMRAEEALRDPRGDQACREGLETTLVDADELIRTFNALLRVARLEAGTLGENTETFDAAALIRDLAEFYEPVVEEERATITAEAIGPLLLNADRQLISQAMTNLVENAMKYGLDDELPPNRRQLLIGANRTDQGAELWVADHGCGIPDVDFDRVLKRFVRLDSARSKPGTGLGLSLVAAVMRQHGGSMELTDNKPGLRVALLLPPERLPPPIDDIVAVSAPAPGRRQGQIDSAVMIK